MTISHPYQPIMHRSIALALSLLISCLTLVGLPAAAHAYPFWAQQSAPDSPREATGKIVCANCHLARKTTQVEIPQAVFPDTVFKATVKIPYEENLKEVAADGSEVALQVGAVMMLPEGFRLAPDGRIPETMKEETEGVYYTQYNDHSDNIILVGPLPGDENHDIVFPVLSPNPANDNNVHFGKYSVHVGGNRGRGQVYPTGEKSNNGVWTADVSGTITAIDANDDGSHVVHIQTDDGEGVEYTETIPVGPDVIVSQGNAILAGAPLTSDPNHGGFGQVDTEIVLQRPLRIIAMLAFFSIIIATQIFFVLKKRQIERVQAAGG